jgi:hypothetical protein
MISSFSKCLVTISLLYLNMIFPVIYVKSVCEKIFIVKIDYHVQCCCGHT